MTTTSCIQELNYDYKAPNFDYSGWEYVRVPGTNWTVCAPKNQSRFDKSSMDVKMYVFDKKYPGQITKTSYWTVPNLKDPVWKYDKMPSGGFSYEFISIPEQWNGSLVEWLNQKVGGTFGSKSCNASDGHGHNKTTDDYPSPYYVKFLTPVISLKNVPGELVKFEACREHESYLAIRVNKQITLIGALPVNGFYGPDTFGDDLLQKVLVDLRVNETGSTL